MKNWFKRLLNLVSAPPVQLGTVVDFTDGVAAVTVFGGGSALLRSAISVSPGDQVYFRDGVIESVAPALPIEEIEV